MTDPPAAPTLPRCPGCGGPAHLAARDGCDWPPVGRKLDAGKAPWHLFPWRAAAAVVAVLEFGARKYSAWNWLRVDRPDERYFAAAVRHLVAWRGGEKLDPESGLPHLAHAACCVLFLLGFEVGEVEPGQPAPERASPPP